MEPGAVADALIQSRVVLFKARGGRPRPQLDDKVLTAWNGLMIAAVARAGRVLSGGEALDRRCSTTPAPGTCVRRRARPSSSSASCGTRSGASCRRRYRARRRRRSTATPRTTPTSSGALLELFQATGDARWLQWALELQDRQDELFCDREKRRLVFSTTGSDPSVLLRMKEDYDGAEPSATSVSAMNVLTLAHLTGDARWRERADQAIASLGGRLAAQGRAVPLMAAALATAITPSCADRRRRPARSRGHADSCGRRAQRRFRPFTVMMPVEPGEAQAALGRLLPWVGGDVDD